MRNKNPIPIIFISVLVCSTLISCSSTKVRQAVLMPANSNEMKNVKTLAVVGFAGDKGNKFSTKMETFFTNIRVKNKRYFSVIDHSTLTSVIRKQNKPITTTKNSDRRPAANNNNTGLILSVNDPIEILGSLFLSKHSTKPSASRPTAKKSAFNRNDAIKTAKIAGADTIITGTINGPHVRNIPYKEDRSVCAEKAGKKCIKYTTIKIGCIKQQGKVNFVMKAVDVNSGAITFSKAYSGASENKYCKDDKYKSAEPVAKLSDIALKQAIAKTRNDVAPYITVVTIELMEKDNSGLANSQQAKMLLETGLRLAKQKKIAQACDNFKLASQSFNQSPALLHNLGVCAEIKNDLDEASRLYTHADSLSKKSHKLINLGLARVNNRRAKNQQVQNQLR